jgi:hypothetical protein
MFDERFADFNNNPCWGVTTIVLGVTSLMFIIRWITNCERKIGLKIGRDDGSLIENSSSTIDIHSSFHHLIVSHHFAKQRFGIDHLGMKSVS